MHFKAERDAAKGRLKKVCKKRLQAREAGERPRDAKKKTSESSKKKPTKKKNKERHKEEKQKNEAAAFLFRWLHHIECEADLKVSVIN